MTKRTPQIESAILEGFARGRSLLAMCREHDLAPMTFQTWKRDDPELALRYELAQADHADAMLDESLRIADDPTSDWAERRAGANADPDDRDHIRHARLKIDTRLRIARIHLRQHDAAMARRAREEALEQEQQQAAEQQRAPERREAEDPARPAYLIALEEACARVDRGERPVPASRSTADPATRPGGSP